MRQRCTFARLAPAVVALAATLAAAMPVASPALAKDKKPSPANAPSQVGTVDASGVYHLSAEELTYDCKRLTGRMRIRLLVVRDFDPAKAPSSMSQSLRDNAKPVVGTMLGSTQDFESNPVKRHQNDIAMLKAYNAQLAAKKCATINLDAELAGKK